MRRSPQSLLLSEESRIDVLLLKMAKQVPQLNITSVGNSLDYLPLKGWKFTVRMISSFIPWPPEILFLPMTLEWNEYIFIHYAFKYMLLLLFVHMFSGSDPPCTQHFNEGNTCSLVCPVNLSAFSVSMVSFFFLFFFFYLLFYKTIKTLYKP